MGDLMYIAFGTIQALTIFTARLLRALLSVSKTNNMTQQPKPKHSWGKGASSVTRKVSCVVILVYGYAEPQNDDSKQIQFTKALTINHPKTFEELFFFLFLRIP